MHGHPKKGGALTILALERHRQDQVPLDSPVGMEITSWALPSILHVLELMFRHQ